MPYQVIGVRVEVSYKCSFCGHEGATDDAGDADEVVGNAFTLFDFNCPNCGKPLLHDENNNYDWDEPHIDDEDYEEEDDWFDEDDDEDDDEDYNEDDE